MSNPTKNKGTYRREMSLFAKWEIGIIVAVVIVLIAYLLVNGFGLVEHYEEAIRNNDLNDFKSICIHNIAVAGTFIAIGTAAITYIAVTIYILLSHRAVEDCRLHCLPIIISPIFLVIENGFLHLFGNKYYEIMMSVFSTTVVGVITFASLKFSFELSTQKKRLSETSQIKPTIYVKKSAFTTKCGSAIYDTEITQNGCYFSGAYVGTIDKIFYQDIKKTGNHFLMKALFYPNVRVFLEKGNQSHRIDYSTCDPQVNDKYYDFIDAYHAWRKSDQSLDFYWIFRDTQNFYYFVQMPTDTIPYNVIGVNEHMMTRLIYYHNENILKQKKKLKKGKSIINYKAMDWFKIPYNFYPDTTCNQV